MNEVVKKLLIKHHLEQIKLCDTYNLINRKHKLIKVLKKLKNEDT
jgi:hypothetical protein